MQMASRLLFVALMLACAASAHASGETNCAKLAEICTVALQWRVLQVYQQFLIPWSDVLCPPLPSQMAEEKAIHSAGLEGQAARTLLCISGVQHSTYVPKSRPALLTITGACA